MAVRWQMPWSAAWRVRCLPPGRAQSGSACTTVLPRRCHHDAAWDRQFVTTVRAHRRALRTPGHSAILSDMPLTRRFPWLRLFLAVLALVAGQVSSARASMGATCPRRDAGHVAVLTGSSLAGMATSAAHPGGADHAAHAAVPHRAPNDGPTVPAGAPQCVTSVATLPPLTAAPAVLLAWSTTAVPCWPEARPTSHAPAPPFRPPRAI